MFLLSFILSMVLVRVASQTRAGRAFRRLTTGKSSGGLDQMFDSKVAPTVAVKKIVATQHRNNLPIQQIDNPSCSNPKTLKGGFTAWLHLRLLC